MTKNKEILLEILKDTEDFAKMKKIKCPPIYFLGGSGCIIGGYLDRGTTDIDFVDMNYPSKVGRIIKLFEKFDMLDLYVTTIASGFENRAIKLKEFKFLDFYVLSREDIIVSKLGRYSEKDVDDIDILIRKADKKLIKKLIEDILNKEDFSIRVKEQFILNIKKFKERYNV